jgi:hypothetical protein
MRVPVLAPALMRNQRSRFVRPFGGFEASGIRPSQMDEGGEGESSGEEEEGGGSGDEGGGSGEGGADQGDHTIESE